ncbi:transmembrane protein 127-like [Physella acuta]|uniref:transmembrane protein 127-like n=1 Tax=Physella acuta TaxID=109671 RepID=UPI0027DB75DF|nr:transmembrane protein 127-like [Physella acuta]XP_059159332.1 transmembrane protein 127-like [Physella acuta]XP_059159333.1 transmembrane protein 127-like [Physella acuta]XP_059159334.1 transmembrane protein 127-like [Physella acuta]
MSLVDIGDSLSPSRSALDQDVRLSQQQQASSLPPPVVDPGFCHSSRALSSSRDANRIRSSRRNHGHRSRSSSSRSRSRHRHSSRHGRYSTRMYFKHKERNFAAAIFSMGTIVLLCTALEPDWINLTGGGCRLLHGPAGSLKQLSTTQFFYNGHFYKNYPQTEPEDVIYKFGPSSNDIMVNCVTYSTVLLFKTSIAFVFIAVVCSLSAFLLDLIGPSYQLLKLLRRNAIFNILTVVMCVTINLFTYWITTAVDKLQVSTRAHDGSKIQVTFDVSFYLVTAAGGLSVIATACNCLRRHVVYESAETPSNPEFFYYDDNEPLLPPPSPNADSAALYNFPPPPAYTP